MTPRERVLAALNHQEPDRTPIDLSGHRSSGIAAAAYPKLRQCLGLPPAPPRVYDPVQQLAIVDEDVLDILGVDTIELGRAFALDMAEWVAWTLPGGIPCFMPRWARPEWVGDWVLRSSTGRIVARMPEGSYFFDQTHWPFLAEAGIERISDALADCMWHAFPSPPGPHVSQAELAATAAEFRRRTDRAILGIFGGSLFELGQYLYRMDRFLEYLGDQPREIHEFLDKLTEIHLVNLDRYLETVGRHIDVIVFGDDLGGQCGPLLSPKMYREFFKPRHAALWRRAKELADVKVMLHSCGSIRLLLNDLIEAGIDAVNPVQTSGEGMEAAALKREFGRDITFWGGGCDTQRVLLRSSPEEVKQHVRGQIRSFSGGGGFVFQQVHNIQADVPPRNIVAMFEAVQGRAL